MKFDLNSWIIHSTYKYRRIIIPLDFIWLNRIFQWNLIFKILDLAFFYHRLNNQDFPPDTFHKKFDKKVRKVENTGTF